MIYRENTTPVNDDNAMRIFILGGGCGKFAPAMLVYFSCLGSFGLPRKKG